MKRYEMLVLFTSDASVEKQDEFKNKIEEILKEHSGEIKGCDKWGKMILAYPVRKNDYGVYTLFRFVFNESSKEALLKIKNYIGIRCGDFISRYVVSLIKGNFVENYRRPDSLEASPTKDKTIGVRNKVDMTEEILQIEGE